MSTMPPTGPEPGPAFPAPQGADPAQQWVPGPSMYSIAPPPPYFSAPPAPPRPRALGVASMAIAIAVFVLSIVASVVVGMSAGPLASRTASSFSFNTSDLTPDQAAAFAPVALLMGAQILLGTILGITALVLGIIAAATKRGRAFGVVGIAVAAAAPIVSFLVYTVALGLTLPPA
ncbi:hypothetical protein [Leifsonia shinshuensis]|uniref:hypothetical protein n=1 Tax=Leifsonia shinshuensis TaxID=150026 RepID=UPI001F50C6C7|nr:hypothetical protein [Leifsonia shinshuensis]